MLRFIMKEVGIEKRLSIHCTRHTFAVSALTLSMSIETVSDIMGNNDLKTTQIYAKIIDDKRKEEMSKWNNSSFRFNTIICTYQVYRGIRWLLPPLVNINLLLTFQN
jgi:hypothetical protein